jgi:hypothetical protein
MALSNLARPTTVRRRYDFGTHHVKFRQGAMSIGRVVRLQFTNKATLDVTPQGLGLDTSPRKTQADIDSALTPELMIAALQFDDAYSAKLLLRSVVLARKPDGTLDGKKFLENIDGGLQDSKEEAEMGAETDDVKARVKTQKFWTVRKLVLAGVLAASMGILLAYGPAGVQSVLADWYANSKALVDTYLPADKLGDVFTSIAKSVTDVTQSITEFPYQDTARALAETFAEIAKNAASTGGESLRTYFNEAIANAPEYAAKVTQAIQNSTVGTMGTAAIMSGLAGLGTIAALSRSAYKRLRGEPAKGGPPAFRRYGGRNGLGRGSRAAPVAARLLVSKGPAHSRAPVRGRSRPRGHVKPSIPRGK